MSKCPICNKEEVDTYYEPCVNCWEKIEEEANKQDSDSPFSEGIV
jgi:hypothetical protein